MGGLWELYKKEFRAIIFMLIVATGVSLVWHIFSIYQLDTWGQRSTLALNFVPLFIYSLLMFYLGFQSFRREWDNDTIYLLFLLPKYAWQLIGIKLLVTFSLYLFVSSLSILIIFLFYRDTIAQGVNFLPLEIGVLELIIRSCLLYIILGIKFYVLSQFSYLFSRFFETRHILVSLIVFLTSSYLLIWAARFLAPLFYWLPELLNSRLDSLYLEWLSPDLPYVGAALALIGIFFIFSSLLLDKFLEV